MGILNTVLANSKDVVFFGNLPSRHTEQFQSCKILEGSRSSRMEFITYPGDFEDSGIVPNSQGERGIDVVGDSVEILQDGVRSWKIKSATWCLFLNR